jgi:dCTP deaminase
MSEQTSSLFPEPENQTKPTHTTGILPSQEIERLIESNRVSAKSKIEPAQIQPASMDLRLGSTAYRVRASFLPGAQTTVATRVRDLVMHELDLSRPAVLEKGCVYIVPLMESVQLPPKVWGKANPKSTTGRLDVFTRLITDFAEEFEIVKAGYAGPLYVEIVPRTFSVLVHEGTKLNQIRFMRGEAETSLRSLRKLDEKETLSYQQDDTPGESFIHRKGLFISIDLKGTGGSEIIGYKAKAHTPLIDLDRVNHYDPSEFWEPIRSPEKRNLVLNPHDFYILISKEKVRVPQDYAAEMVAYDPSVGEFRTHYAGFFDPGFGYGNNDIRGTHAVLEVRCHEVPFLLEDGQWVGRLIYERLLARPEKVYGTGIGSSYQGQSLSLSKQFKRQ